MKRELHNLIQGSPEWHQFRAEHFGASEPAAMLGVSKYMTRSELLHLKSTGIVPEVDRAKQAIFDAGHATEAAARPMIEALIGDELYPATYSFGKLSASCDGLTMDGETAFEHKLWNADLAAAVARKELPEEHQPQCQQTMLVTGAQRVIFVVSDGTPENMVHMYVTADPVWFERIQAGWAQFALDLANYQVPEVIPAAVAAPTMQLPALSIQVKGEITLIDNLKMFGEGLKKFVEALPKEPSTDQEFADCKQACKVLQEAQDRLDAAEAHALGQIASFDEMKRTKALYWDLARTTRLAVEKLVVAREQQIKVEIRQAGNDAFALHVANLNTRIGKPYLSVPIPDFAGAMKNKRTIASLRDAVDTLLASSKIAVNEIADRISVNLNTLRELAKGQEFLFADTGQIVLKANDDLTALVHMRLNDHRQSEAKRLEAEREQIRAEEQRKAQAEAEAQRIAQERETREARDKADREAREAREAKERELKAIQDRIEAEASKEREAIEAKAAAERRAKEEAEAQERARQRAATEAAEAKIREEQRAKDEAERIEREKFEAEAQAKRTAVMETASTDQAIRILRARIKDQKPYAGIAKAIDVYLEKQRVAA